MKYRVAITFIAIVILLMTGFSAQSQQMEKGTDLSFSLGVNLGATTPVPIPDALDITRYNPRFNLTFGTNLAYYFNERWGIGTGITLDWKGMNVHTEVTDVHLSVDVPNVGTLTGYVTGKNTTQTNTLYLIQPVYGSFRITSRWQVKAGIYMAEVLHRKFKGDVSDVIILVESPAQQEREIEYATFDYKKDVRKFDLGGLAGAEFRMNEHIGFFADFTWGFIPYFSSEVPIHFTMRNIYFSLEVTYRIR
ncbi:MAG: PorT family protein [Tannerellaceae bacterium]|nr:PorT family protein [Tannerellaceae bacterium]